MRKDLTEIIFILDQSGSMNGLEKDTIGGFNSLIEKQKEEAGDAVLTTVLFNHESTTIHDRVPIDKVEPMTSKQYRACGCTALLDAVGDTVSNIKLIQKHIREEDRPAKTMVIITTDGYENASTKYDYKTIKKLIETQKKEYNWEFLFLGANIDAGDVAESVGIDRSRAATYKCDGVGTKTNFRALSKAASVIRNSSVEEVQCCLDNWDEEIVAYSKK